MFVWACQRHFVTPQKSNFIDFLIHATIIERTSSIKLIYVYALSHRDHCEEKHSKVTFFIIFFFLSHFKLSGDDFRSSRNNSKHFMFISFCHNQKWLRIKKSWVKFSYKNDLKLSEKMRMKITLKN